MSEATFHSYVRDGVKPFAEFAKHNDSCTIGVPDCSMFLRAARRNIWIELKSAAWPKRKDTKVWWDHYTEEQALWLLKRDGWLFVRMDGEYLLFDGQQSWAIWERRGLTRDEMNLCARAIWKRSVRWGEFVEVIANDNQQKRIAGVGRGGD